MLDSDWLIANSKFLKTPWLDWMIFISARLNSVSILILFHVKNNCSRNLLFLFTFIHFLSLFNFSFLKIWDILNLQFFFLFLFLFIEMPLPNGNKRIAFLECGREYTRKDASRHRNHCDVLKCSNCNFYTFSSEELTNHIKKKQCQYNVKVCARKSQKTD